MLSMTLNLDSEFKKSIDVGPGVSFFRADMILFKEQHSLPIPAYKTGKLHES